MTEEKVYAVMITDPKEMEKRIEELQTELLLKDQKIDELRNMLNGTVRANGYRTSDGRFEINTSDILTKLIKLAAKHCDSYASDLFVQWKYNVEKVLETGEMQTQYFVFAFRDGGIDHKEWWELHKDDPHYYKEVWFLSVIVDETKITMDLHK